MPQASHLFIPHPLNCCTLLHVLSLLIQYMLVIVRWGQTVQGISVRNGRGKWKSSSSSICLIPFFHILCVVCVISLHTGFRIQHLWGSGVPWGSGAGDESRSGGLWGRQAAGSAGHRPIYSSQALPGPCLPACQVQEPGTVRICAISAIIALKNIFH